MVAPILDFLCIVRREGEIPVPSQSLLPLLTDRAVPDGDADAVFSEQEDTRVVRTRKWVYFKRFRDAPSFPLGDELYDVENDPHCLNNLIDDPKHAGIKTELSKRLDVWMKSQGDEGAATEALAHTRGRRYKENKRPAPQASPPARRAARPARRAARPAPALRPRARRRRRRRARPPGWPLGPRRADLRRLRASAPM